MGFIPLGLGIRELEMQESLSKCLEWAKLADHKATESLSGPEEAKHYSFIASSIIASSIIATG